MFMKPESNPMIFTDCARGPLRNAKIDAKIEIGNRNSPKYENESTGRPIHRWFPIDKNVNTKAAANNAFVTRHMTL
jgi:hypothetical protein